jgi:muramidase (phage lysozyme)
LVDPVQRQTQGQGSQQQQGGESPIAAIIRLLTQMFGGMGYENDFTSPAAVQTSQSVKQLQAQLAQQGLYPSTGAFAQDGIAGPVTEHAMKLRDEPGYAERYMQTALQDRNLSATDIMKIQGALNRLGYDVGDVNGRMNNETREDITRYLKEHPSAQAAPEAVQAAAPQTGIGRVISSITESVKSTRDHVFAPESTPGSARSLLGLIGQHESGQNYNAVYGHSKGNGVDFTNMTVNEVLAWQRQYVNDGSASSAVGRYQIIQKTLRGLRDEMGLSGDEKFDQSMQDRMAMRLLERRGLESYRNGRITEAQFMDNVAKEWASMPTRTGRGHYDGDGLNAVGVSTAPVLAAIRDIRAEAPVQTAAAAPTPAAARPHAPVQTARNDDIDFGRQVVNTVKEGMSGAANRLGLNSAFETAGNLWDKATDAVFGNDAPATQMAQSRPRTATLGG